MIQAYIAGPLVNEKYRDLTFYEAIANLCIENGIQPFLPHILTEPTDILADPYIVFKQNFESLASSNLLIAEVSEPSHGVGSELMQGFIQKIPIICLAINGKKLSRMITGNPMVRTVIRYESKADCITQLRNYLATRQ